MSQSSRVASQVLKTDSGIESQVRQVMNAIVPGCDQCGRRRSTTAYSCAGSNPCMPRRTESFIVVTLAWREEGYDMHAPIIVANDRRHNRRSVLLYLANVEIEG